MSQTSGIRTNTTVREDVRSGVLLLHFPEIKLTVLSPVVTLFTTIFNI